jgi:glycine dehydrogenase subunit 1
MFIPHTDADRAAMLRTVGIEKLDDLFNDVPAKYRFPTLNLPPALTEMEVSIELQDIAQANETVRELACFLGAGVYNPGSSRCNYQAGRIPDCLYSIST